MPFCAFYHFDEDHETIYNNDVLKSKYRIIKSGPGKEQMGLVDELKKYLSKGLNPFVKDEHNDCIYDLLG